MLFFYRMRIIVVDCSTNGHKFVPVCLSLCSVTSQLLPEEESISPPLESQPAVWLALGNGTCALGFFLAAENWPPRKQDQAGLLGWQTKWKEALGIPAAHAKAQTCHWGPLWAGPGAKSHRSVTNEKRALVQGPVFGVDSYVANWYNRKVCLQ